MHPEISESNEAERGLTCNYIWQNAGNVLFYIYEEKENDSECQNKSDQ